MKRTLLLTGLILFSCNLFAQDGDEFPAASDYDDQYISYAEETKPFRVLDSLSGYIGIYAATIPFFKQQSFGIGMEGLFRVTTNFSTGLSLAVTGRRITPDFGYTIGDARMTFADLSWLNELTLLHKNNFEIGARIALGWAGYMLADNSIKERYWVWTDYGGYEAERALQVAGNNFFKLAPGMAIRYRLGKSIQLEANGAYNFYFGNAAFGDRADFNNYVLQLGIKVDVD